MQFSFRTVVKAGVLTVFHKAQGDFLQLLLIPLWPLSFSAQAPATFANSPACYLLPGCLGTCHLLCFLFCSQTPDWLTPSPSKSACSVVSSTWILYLKLCPPNPACQIALALHTISPIAYLFFLVAVICLFLLECKALREKGFCLLFLLCPSLDLNG